MKNLTIDSVIEKNKLFSDTPYLLLLEISVLDPETKALEEVLRVCQNNEDFEFNGQVYAAANFMIDIRSEVGEMPTLQLSINDTTGAFHTQIEPYDGGLGFEVKLMVVDGSLVIGKPEIEEEFEVTSATVSGFAVSWDLGISNPLAISFPRRMQHRELCSWRFKSRECGYSGEKSSCDYTLDGGDGCVDKDNTRRFGGYPTMLRN